MFYYEIRDRIFEVIYVWRFHFCSVYNLSKSVIHVLIHYPTQPSTNVKHLHLLYRSPTITLSLHFFLLQKFQWGHLNIFPPHTLPFCRPKCKLLFCRIYFYIRFGLLLISLSAKQFFFHRLDSKSYSLQSGTLNFLMKLAKIREIPRKKVFPDRQIRT